MWKLRSQLQFCGQSPLSSSYPPGKSWPRSQGCLWKCPVPSPFPVRLCSASPTSHLLCSLVTSLEVPHPAGPMSESQESGHVGFVHKLLAAKPLIYLLMHSLPSVFILLSAQDKWLPYSAELQRLQSSWVCRIYDKAENCLSASFMCARSRTECCSFQMFLSCLLSPREVGWPVGIPTARAWTWWVPSASLASAGTQ